MDEESDEFGLVKYFCSYLQVVLHAVKSYDVGPLDLLPLHVLRTVFVLKNPSPQLGLNL
jgi:hypothetical protein